MIDNIPRLNESETIIVNTDVNTGGGIHWITLFKIENILYIYDPLGKSNKRDNQEILNDYAESQQLKIYFYPYENQYKDSSLCGWFSIYVGKVFTQQKPKTIKECDHIIYTIFGDSADDTDVQKIIDAFGTGQDGQLDEIYDGVNGGTFNETSDGYEGAKKFKNPYLYFVYTLKRHNYPIAKIRKYWKIFKNFRPRTFEEINPAFGRKIEGQREAPKRFSSLTSKSSDFEGGLFTEKGKYQTAYINFVKHYLKKGFTMKKIIEVWRAEKEQVPLSTDIILQNADNEYSVFFYPNANVANGGALIDNVKGLVDAFHGNRMGFNPAMRKILEQVGSIPIAKMYVGRSPLSKTASLLIKIFKSKRRVNISPDKLFHLFFFLVLKNGKTLVLEKLEQLNLMYLDIKKLLAVEYMPVQINQQYNINSLLSNAINKYGEYQIFDYNALQGRNCQNFIINVMNANSIMITPLLKQFILQDVSQLVPKFASKILYWITSLKNRGNQIVQGAGENEDFIFI
jgi:hypothetical protein